MIPQNLKKFKIFFSKMALAFNSQRMLKSALLSHSFLLDFFTVTSATSMSNEIKHATIAKPYKNQVIKSLFKALKVIDLQF
jgi:hypothetical protein